MPVLRQDPLTGEWVIIATERAKRPETFARPREVEKESLPSRVENCPFCPGNEHMTPPQVLSYQKENSLYGKASPGNGGQDKQMQASGSAATATEDWSLRVIPNKFPALEATKNQESEDSLDVLDALQRHCNRDFFRSYSGYGVHEVIIETPDHNRQLIDQTEEEVVLLLRSFGERIRSLEEDPRLRYVQVFRNHRPEAGASIEHPHCQLIALPYIPPLLDKEYRLAHDYYLDVGQCLLCTLAQEEEHSGDRVVALNDHFIAYIPFAAPLPFSTWIVPRQHLSALEKSPPGMEEQLAPIVKDVIGRLDQRLADPPYNFYLHTAPLRSESLPYFHWHLEIIPKLTIVAGWEMATGTYINVSRPEEAASYLRDGPGLY